MTSSDLTQESLASLSRIVSYQNDQIAEQRALIQKQGAQLLRLNLENHVLRSDAPGFLEDEINRQFDGILCLENFVANYLNFGLDAVPVGDVLRAIGAVKTYADVGKAAPWMDCVLSRLDEEG
jgi:hypothetical protein